MFNSLCFCGPCQRTFIPARAFVILLLVFFGADSLLAAAGSSVDRGALLGGTTTPENFAERLDALYKWYEEVDDSMVSVLVPWGVQTYWFQYTQPGFNPDAESCKRVDDYIKMMSFVDGNQQRIARVRLSPSGPFKGGTHTEASLIYEVGELGFAEGATFCVYFNNAQDWGTPQLDDPSKENYVSVRCTRPDTELTAEYKGMPLPSHEGRSGARLFVKLVKGQLRPGDTISVIYGDRSKGSPGFRVQTYSEDDSRFYMESDFDASSVYIPVGWGAAEVVGGEAHHVIGVAPTIVAPDEEFSLHARIEDEYKNVATGFEGILQLKRDGKVLSTRQMGKDKAPIVVFDGLKLKEPGIYYFDLADSEGKIAGRSNPVVVRAGLKNRVYWGQIHGHAAGSDGTGSPEEWYRFARDVSFCDFACLTEHDVWYTQKEWRNEQKVAESFNADGRFVTLFGWEWTRAVAEGGGHHNIYFRKQGGPLLWSTRYPKIDEVYRILHEQFPDNEVVVIPHTHIPGDWRFWDVAIQNLVEIYSIHGSFEWFGNNFAANSIVGFIGAGDDHTGHPGNSPPARWLTRGGMAAAWSSDLSRDSIWSALKERRVYASTEQHIFLDFEANGQPMGSSTETKAPLKFHIEAAGTAPLDQLTLMRDGKEPVMVESLSSPKPGEKTTRYRVNFTSGCDPGDYRGILGGARFAGKAWIEGNEIADIAPYGLDDYTDIVRREGQNQIVFDLQTRGDSDGFVLHVKQPGAGKLIIELTEAEDKKTTLTFPIADLPTNGQKQDLEIQKPREGTSKGGEEQLAKSKGAGQPRPFRSLVANMPRAVSVKPLAAEERWSVSKDFVIEKPGEGEHYYYARIVQVDDGTAWSSPIWITNSTTEARR